MASTDVGIAAAPDAWSAVASTGAVDEADSADVRFTSGVADFSGTALASDSAVIRYNVVATPGIDTFNDAITVRFRDNGTAARVQVRLLEYEIATGFTNTLVTLDSDSFSSSSTFQAQTVFFGSCDFDFDFANNAYFVEATLSRTSTAGNPGLAIVQVGGVNLC